MDQLPSPTCEDTIQGGHFIGALTGGSSFTRSGLAGSHDSRRPVSGSEGRNWPFWAQSRPAAGLGQPHVPMPWIYGLGSHGGGLQCPLLAHPMVSRGDRRSARRVLRLEAIPPPKSGATNPPPPPSASGPTASGHSRELTNIYRTLRSLHPPGGCQSNSHKPANASRPICRIITPRYACVGESGYTRPE